MRCTVCSVGLAVLLGGSGFFLNKELTTTASAQQINAQAEARDVEILGHGPIHEAFAQPAAPILEPTILVQKQPPAPVEELPPDVKPEGDHVVWIPGYWAFDNERNDFIWVSGFWRNVPPNRVWVGGYWTAEGDGFRWVAGYWSEPSQTQVYYPPPPEPIPEAAPPAPNGNSFYVTGTWIYRDTRYVWRPGYWSPYHTGWLWSQPRYAWTPGGYVFTDGYWDYDFPRRGVLFAPAYFGPGYFATNQYYRPSYALTTSLLYTSLFVQPNASSYYFGDYYAPRYASRGFVPWIDYRYGGRYADPAWSYYAWRNRSTPRWEEQTRAAYASRQRGETAAPPRRVETAKSQPQPSTTNNNTQNVNLVVPVQQLQAQSDVKLRTVTKEETVAIQRHADDIRNVAKARQKVERKVDATSNQRVVQANLPLPQAALRSGKTENAPPPPLVPKVNPDAKAPLAKQGNPLNPVPAPTQKGKDAGPGSKTAAPPTESAPPQTKEQPPKTEPKTAPVPQAPTPPSLAPKVAPMPQPKADPKTTPLPKTNPPAPQPQPKAPQTNPPPPQPKSAPPVPQPNALQPIPMPQPKTAPPPQPKAPSPAPTPQPKAQPPLPVPQPKGPPAPLPKAPQAPTPQPIAPPPQLKTPPVPVPQPKAIPPAPKAPDVALPKVTPRPAPAQLPEAPKGNGKEGKGKEKD